MTPIAAVASQVLTAHLEGEAVLLDLQTKAYFRVNETGAQIWRALEAGAGREQIVSELTATFDVSAADAASELDALLRELTQRGLLTGAAAA